MKKIICILLIAAAAIYSQEHRLLQTKLADILAQIPAGDQDYSNTLMNELLATGDQGLHALCKMLVPAGTGDDTNARDALNTLAKYLGTGPSPQRDAFELLLQQEIAQASDKEVQTFLINQLQVAGTDQSVAALAPLLSNESICEPAAQALLAIRGAKATGALLSAMKTASETVMPVLIKALGELRSKDALPLITAQANSANIKIQKTAMAALAQIGDPSSQDLLLDAASRHGFSYDASNATAAYLNYLNRLGADGNYAACFSLAQSLLDKNMAQNNFAVVSAALKILVQYNGYQALPALISAASQADKALRNSALSLASMIPDAGATRKWIELAASSSPEVKNNIIGMLGKRGDPLALAFCQAQLNSAEPQTRMAAAEAAVQLDKTFAVKLIPCMNGKSEEEMQHYKTILAYSLPDYQLDQVASALASAPAATKAVLISLISDRHGSRFFQTIFAFTADQDTLVRNASLSALKNTASNKDLPVLLTLLAKNKNPNEVDAIQQGVIASFQGYENPDSLNLLLQQTLRSSKNKEKIVQVFPYAGTGKLLSETITLFDKGKGKAKEAAFAALLEWKNTAATDKLLQICSSMPLYQKQAFTGFIKQIASSDLPAEQKLLQIKKIMPWATDAEDKKLALNALASARHFLSLLYAASFLDDAALQQDACRVAMALALPPQGSKDGLNGTIVRNILGKCIEVMSGAESDYMKENIRTYLAAMPQEEGFVPIFNGQDLSGWKGLVENPIIRADMNPDTLAAKQAQADLEMVKHWSATDAEIHTTGKGNNIRTTKDYADFEMLVDWKIGKKGDSGIYLRGTPQVQIWDTSRVEVGAQVGSGGLYNNEKNPSKPLLVADNPVGDWNTFYIKMIGEKVTVYLNGRLVVDTITLENYWDRILPIFPSGQIELQAHGTDLAFRNLYVHEIKDKEYKLTAQEKQEGFVSLFNGKDLDNWLGNKMDYVVEDGVLVIRPQQGSHGNLYTEKEYSDFAFRFEFQLTPGANNGLGVRAPLEGDAAYVGMELQILDNTAPIYAHLQPYQYHGSVYGVIPARREFLRPVGQWNEEEAILQGNRVKVILNGTVIVDGDIAEASKNGTMDHNPHLGLLRKSGHIGWLGHGSVVKFRTIRIKELGAGR